ncbi:P-loop containing nucleoside triphosphatehydrolases superfamily protein [Striga asiatica]|uniref:P-loop containing nucleoside triphosphatehydrolases superfamily protein n=1 Tax=Striga asiatica TaxID=4170 RepID=A0A5A7P7X5_STRAF|nr:P-loop containing nucleoside triphosphatehydrolases superfamily protein [Striga asiatica]
MQKTAKRAFFKTQTADSFDSEASERRRETKVSIADSRTVWKSRTLAGASMLWTMLRRRERQTGPWRAAFTVNLLELKIVRVGFSLGRVAKTGPFSIRASWARLALATTMMVREPMRRVKIGP